MRALFNDLLVGLILACPILCRATDDGCCADLEVTSGTPDEHHTPAPSNDAKGCICGGAIKAADDRDHGFGPGGLSPAPGTPHLVGLWRHHPSLASPHARGGSPPGEAGWRGPRRVH